MGEENHGSKVGAFELVEPLHCSSERILWRASHVKTGTSAAVKILTGELDAGRTRSLEREVRAQARLQHPGVVRLFDYGVIGEDSAEAISRRLSALEDSELRADHPYLAMEWASLGSLWNSLPLERWEDVRRVIVSVLKTLAYAHARDVIHRDLKPENILIFDEDGGGRRFKLGDFGLAHATGVGVEIDQEALASVSGTPGYLPPEQARGEWRDFGPWTDLYSVGCLTWRLVCRALPFTGSSAFGVILKHVDADRPPLEPAIPVPADLESWVHQAMAIDPEDRFQSAADALKALPNGESVQSAMPDSWRDIESPGGRQDSTDRAIRLEGLELFGLREIPLVGRHRERDALWSELHSVVDGGGIRIVHIEGDAGVGKSRLAEWLVRVASETGVAHKLRVLSSKGRPGRHEGLKGMTRRVLSCRNLDRRPLRERLSTKLPELQPSTETANSGKRDDDRPSQTARDALALAEWLAPTEQEGDRLASEPQFTSEKQRRLLLARLLRRLSAYRPAILWLDDVPWDAETLDVLETYEPSSPATPDLLVVATGRTDEFADNPTIRHRLEDLRERHGGARIDLAPLDRNNQRTLIDSMLPLDSHLVERLLDQTEGNPLFAVQLLQHWVEQGYVEPSARGFQVAPHVQRELPADLVELWAGRIERLEELSAPSRDGSVRKILELAAVQGRTVEADLLEKACDLAGLQFQDQLIDQLVARGLAVEAEGGWEFAHGLLVESLQRSAQKAGRWSELHRIWAEVLDGGSSHGDGRWAARRAEHLLEAGDEEAALEPLLVTARRRGLLGNMTERYTALTRRQEILDNLNVAADDYRRVENETHLSAHLVAEERHKEARSVARRAYQIASEHEWPFLRARTLKTLSECDKDAGDYASSRQNLDEAIEAAKQIDEFRLVAALYADRSWMSLIGGNTDQAREQIQQCLRFAEKADANYWIVNAKYQLGQVEMSVGNRDVAETCFQEALFEARRHGLQRLEALCINSLGDFAKEDRKWEDALDKFEQFDQIAKAVQINRLSLLARLNMAQVHAVRGDTSKAEQLIQSAARQLADAEITDHEGLIDTIRLVVAIQRSDLEAAIAIFSSYREEWPPNQRLDHDVPWMLEQAFRVARQQFDEEHSEIELADDHRAAKLVGEIGRRSQELYQRLGDEEGANRIASLREDPNY